LLQSQGNGKELFTTGRVLAKGYTPAASDTSSFSVTNNQPAGPKSCWSRSEKFSKCNSG